MPSTTPSKILFSLDYLRIELFRAAGGPSRRLACIFSPGDNERLDGNLFGGSFLVQNGFDVLSFKTLKNDWFQTIPPQAFAEVTRAIGPGAYDLRIGSGASMGAYSAIVFSRLLDLDRVLAYSPQFTPSDKFDQRFSKQARRVAWKFPMSREAISERCSYFFVYDPADIDLLHIRKYREIIDPRRMFELKLPHAGHPTTHCLHEIGLLKAVTLGVATQRAFPEIDFRAAKKASTIYLGTLAYAAAKRGKYPAALAMVSRQIGLNRNSFSEINRRTLLLVAKGLAPAKTHEPAPSGPLAAPWNALRRLLPGGRR